MLEHRQVSLSGKSHIRLKHNFDPNDDDDDDDDDDVDE